MGGNQQKQQKQVEPAQIEYLRKSNNNVQLVSTTLPSFLPSQPKLSQFYVMCPRCKFQQFDDALDRKNSCQKCQLTFLRKDDNVEILNTNDRIAQCQYGANQYLDAVVLSVNEQVSSCIIFKASPLNYPFPTSDEQYYPAIFRLIGACFNIEEFEFRVIGCSSHMQGIVGLKTQIYCYESYCDSTLREVKLYSQRHGIESELHHYLVTHPQENLLISDSYTKINSQELLVLKCSNTSSGRVNPQTRIKCVSVVPRLHKISLILHRGPDECIKNGEALLQYVVQPYFTGMTRYVERGQIIKISSFTFEVLLQEECGFVIPNQTQLSLDLEDNLLNLRVQQNTVQERNEVHQIESLHRLLNTFISLSDNLGIDHTGCEENEIQQMPVRTIDLQLIAQLDEDHRKCLICLCDYEDQDIVKTIPCCITHIQLVHYFHNECIERWLKKSRLCPICKNKLSH